MPISRRHLLQLAAGASALPLPALAETYPTGPIQLVVGFPEGGPVDIAARTIGPWLAERLGQPVGIDNRPGASGNGATRDVARAAPDGHELLVCGPVNTINTTLFPDLDFDFGRDIAAVAGICRVPLIVEVHPAVPTRTLGEFISLAKAKPGELRVAYAGRGTPQHVAIELFAMMAGVRLTLMPYAGSTPALNDLLAGRVEAMFDPMPSSIRPVREGRLVPLAVTTPERSAALPDVPSVADLVPGYEAGSWFGLGAPRGTPAAVVVLINAEVNAGLKNEAMLRRLAGMGAAPMPGSPGAFARFIADETARYRAVIRAAGIAAG